MSNQRVNDMSNRNYNNYSIAKKTIAVVFLSLIGMLNVMAQTGTVNRTFIMTGFGENLIHAIFPYFRTRKGYRFKHGFQ